MVGVRRVNNGPNYGLITVIVIVIGVLFGILFDFVLTKIEYSLFPQPEQYVEYIDKYSEKYDVPKSIVYAVIKAESGFDSTAKSNSGAVGLMQLMPETFLELTKKIDGRSADVGMRYDPETNIKCGIYYLSCLYSKYEDWNCVIAAYNAGPGNVDRWLEDPEISDVENKKLNIKKIPFKETRKHVHKVNKYAQKYTEFYGIE